MGNISANDILKFASDNGMIDLESIKGVLNMRQREYYLEKHPYKIWQGVDNNWRTYLPDKERGRILKKRSTKDGIEDLIIGYWKEMEENPTIKELYDRWIMSKVERGDISRATKDRYDRQFVVCFDKFGDRRIKSVTAIEIEDFMIQAITTKKLTQKAYSNFRTLVYGIFKRAKKEKLINYSITEIVSDMEVSRKLFRKNIKDDSELIFSENETEMFDRYFTSRDNDIIDMGIWLLFKTGLRPGELAGLKVSDVKGYSLFIHRTEIRYNGEDGTNIYEVRDFPKTDAGIRTVIVPQSARKLLNDILASKRKGEFLFEKNGKRVFTYQFRGRLRYICNKMNLNQRSLNKIRKTYGSILIDKNVDESVIISQMGHTDIATTKKYYYKDRKSFEKKEAILSAALG